MQRFQQILQKAISENALAVDLVGNTSPRSIGPGGESNWVDFGNLELDYIQNLFTMLFPNGVDTDPAKGQIDIPNYGRLLTIAIPQPIPTIKIFLPSGHNLYEQAWRDVQAGAATPAPPEPSIADNPFDEAANEAINPEQPSANQVETGSAMDITGATPPPLPPQAVASGGGIPENDFNVGDTAQPNKDMPVDLRAPPPELTPPPDALTPVDLTQNEDAPPLDVATPVDQPMDVAPLAPPANFSSPVADISEAPTNPLDNPPQTTAADLEKPETNTPMLTAIDDIAVSEIDTPPAAVRAPDLSAAPDLAVAPDHSANISNDALKTAEGVAQTPSEPAGLSVDQADLSTQVLKGLVDRVAGNKKDYSELRMTIDEGPKDLDKYLNIMLERKASDIHLTSGEPMALRIDGDIVRLPEFVFSEQQIRTLFWPITSEYNQVMFDDENDTDFAYEIPGVARFRVNLFRDRHGMGAVLRHIPSDILSFEQLGLPNIIRNFCYLNKGLVVVTGPTGSGKSTTLAAIIDHINDVRKDHILTLEDPVEFVHPQKNCLIRQREIHKHTHSFARALKAALREDPDIILVGELRDLETTAMAIEIAETGHLVFGTLHTTTAISTIDRIIDQFSADQQEQIRTMLAESLKGVVAQTLLKKIGGGRCAAQEILVVNNAVSALIRESKTHMLANHMQSQKKEGNVLLNEALLNRVVEGLVEPKEAWAKAIDKGGLIARFKSHNIPLDWYAQLMSGAAGKKAS